MSHHELEFLITHVLESISYHLLCGLFSQFVQRGIVHIYTATVVSSEYLLNATPSSYAGTPVPPPTPSPVFRPSVTKRNLPGCPGVGRLANVIASIDPVTSDRPLASSSRMRFSISVNTSPSRNIGKFQLDGLYTFRHRYLSSHDLLIPFDPLVFSRNGVSHEVVPAIPQ